MTERYFIAFLLTGPDAINHRELTRHVSERFGTWKVHERVPPHVTIVRPFELDDVEPVKTFLRDWTQQISNRGQIKFDGFDRFDDAVVFVKTLPDAFARKTAEALRNAIKELPMIPPREDFPDWHPHATLAYKLTPALIKEIWSYVQTLEPPVFNLPFSSVTLFRFAPEETWIVEESFSFAEPPRA